MPAPVVPVAIAVARLVAKHGVPAVQKAIKTQKVKPGSGRRATNQAKNTAKLSRDPNAPRGGPGGGGYYGEAYGAITNKEKKRIQLKGSLGKKTVGKTQRKTINSERNMTDRMVKDAVKRGATKYGSGPLKDGARKPSVPSKTNIKNKPKGKGPRGR
jgi:hypothetical protein